MTHHPSDRRPDADDRDLRERLAVLSLEQKVELLSGASFTAMAAQPAVGLRSMRMSDGPAGVRGPLWDERDPSQSLPSPSAMGATWNPTLVEQLATISAYDAIDKDIDICLGPVVNLQRSPYSGRNFEYYSEDPFLSGQLGAAFTSGLQSQGVAACLKHLVANDSDTERMTVDVIVDERALREVYLAPFETVVRDAAPWSLMSSYNRLNGTYMSEHPLLRDVVKDEWGFYGIIMSDFYSVGTVVEAGSGGLDLAMPAPKVPWGDALVSAVRAGQVRQSAIDDKVLRILRLASRVGALEGSPPRRKVTRDSAAEAQLLREAAAASFVLLSNPTQVLPLEKAAITTVAVIGHAAISPRYLGGGSAVVVPPYGVSPLEGIRSALDGTADVLFAEGARPHERAGIAKSPWLRTAGGRDGVTVEMLDRDGTVLLEEHRDTGEFMWMGHVAPGVDTAQIHTVRVTTQLHAQDNGYHRVGFSGVGGYRFSLDAEVLFDDTIERPPGTDIVEGMSSPPIVAFTRDLTVGHPMDLVLEHTFGSFDPPMPFAVFQLRLDTPFGTAEEEIETAAKTAAEADVAIVVVGTTNEAETEGLDRSNLSLPGHQDELVRRVTAANPRTVVVVNAGAPVLLPWADDVAATVVVWFPGQEFGHALADVLLGDREPGGRLPMSWPAAESQALTTVPTSGVLSYDEGLHVGHRRYDRDELEPHFAFGHGLGYAPWQVIDADASTGSAGVIVRARLQRESDRPAGTVLQVYLSRPDSSVERPVRWLAGFATVPAVSDPATTIEVVLAPAIFQHWASEWVIEPGAFVVELGFSSRDLRLRLDVTP